MALLANIASTKAAIENDVAQVESIGADVASLATGVASAETGLSAVTVVRTNVEADYSRSFGACDLHHTEWNGQEHCIFVQEDRLTPHEQRHCRSLPECRRAEDGGAGSEQVGK